eukprot:CAMPEP_0172491476 /NCGR_PEP_ID=MMETSP1066-20121228/22320_1 /TAXON_ID=671091 /ORGANISM="Coscinodiscus wailesii, Strain CCMP2513" /LENGTH=284 /DNA_ID=CAMNT_0013260547 /DNA_START=119 /DNA_END=973 /DNA_ORIENTATION=+
MTFNESVQNFMKVSSISPRRLNIIFDPADIYTRGLERRYSRWYSAEYTSHNCVDDSSNSLRPPRKSKCTQHQHTSDVSVLENDNRFRQVDGFYVVSNTPDQSKLKSIINNRIDACRSFLNRFDVRRHSNDDSLLNEVKSKHIVSDTPHQQRRHSGNEFASRKGQSPSTNCLASFEQESFRNDDRYSRKSFGNLFEVRKPSSSDKKALTDLQLNEPDPLSSICERRTQSLNDTATFKSKVIDSSYKRRKSGFGTKLLKRKGISPVPRLFEPIVIDRKKGEVISSV